MSDEHTPSLTNLCDSQSALTVGRLLQHLRDPQNLVTYLVFTAWMKFMGVASHIPTVTIG